MFLRCLYFVCAVCGAVFGCWCVCVRDVCDNDVISGVKIFLIANLKLKVAVDSIATRQRERGRGGGLRERQAAALGALIHRRVKEDHAMCVFSTHEDHQYGHRFRCSYHLYIYSQSKHILYSIDRHMIDIRLTSIVSICGMAPRRNLCASVRNVYCQYVHTCYVV